jgi:hypothetical protein
MRYRKTQRETPSCDGEGVSVFQMRSATYHSKPATSSAQYTIRIEALSSGLGVGGAS